MPIIPIKLFINISHNCSCNAKSCKYLKNKTTDECVLKKLKAHLTYKGFGYEDINSVVKELGERGLVLR